ncbi:MAG: tail fiber assembly protein [Limisphaerales bacterium]
MRLSIIYCAAVGLTCAILATNALGQATKPTPKKPGTPPQVGAPIKLERTPAEGEKALKRLPSRRLPPGAQNLSPNQLKSRREQIQQRRLATVRSRISELEAKRKKGRITEKEKSLLNSLRQYLANHQKWLNRERTTKRLAKPSTAPAPAKPSTLTSPKPPSIPKPPILPPPPKPAPKKN